MDKLNALTPQQKLLVLVAPLALIGFVFWQFFLGDLSNSLAAAQNKVRTQQNEYNKLREYEKARRQESARQAREDEEARLVENREMLPEEEEIPMFIMSIQRDAYHSNVTIRKIERQEPEVEDYYKVIPIRIEANGKPPDIVDFFQTLGGPKKRVVNIRRLTLQRPKASQYDVTEVVQGDESEYDKAARTRRMKKEEKGMTNEERRMLKLRRWMQTNTRLPVVATFFAYTFSYTGEPMPEELRKRRTRRRRL